MCSYTLDRIPGQWYWQDTSSSFRCCPGCPAAGPLWKAVIRSLFRSLLSGTNILFWYKRRFPLSWYSLNPFTTNGGALVFPFQRKCRISMRDSSLSSCCPIFSWILISLRISERLANMFVGSSTWGSVMESKELIHTRIKAHLNICGSL